MKLIILTAFTAIVQSYSQKNSECLQKYFHSNAAMVCVCNADNCDFMEPYSEEEIKENYVVYTSNLKGDRFKKTIGQFSNYSADDTCLLLNRRKRYQKIYGFGGAFTDSTGINFNSLDNNTRDVLLRTYFAKEGIEYNFGRVPIAATDFSTHVYSYIYDDTVDVGLENFTLTSEDFIHKIPLIKAARKLRNGDLTLFASSWVAPRWMKTNGAYSGFTFLKEEYFQMYSDYLVKFLDAYKEHGIEFWGITTGNEPSLVLLPFTNIPTVGFTSNARIRWISNHLGPTLRKSQYSRIKLIALDDQRAELPIEEYELKNDTVRKYVDGVGIHWYTNHVIPVSWVARFHDQFPDLFILGTEACRGQLPWDKHVDLGSWIRGEEYANDIIEDLQNWMCGWMDWNMALDLQGGPTYIRNFVDCPIIINATAGEFYKQPMFYAIGHFSKFLQKDSVRIDLKERYNNVQLVAFERPDGATVVIILNRQNHDVGLKICDQPNRTINLNVSQRSINSLIYL